MLREQAPVWIADLQQSLRFNCKEVAAAHGIRTGFAFPIIVGGTVVALMEVFSTQRRAQDPLMMDAAQTIASQLSRLVERALAHDSNARLASIVESSQDAIISRAVDGTVVTWNTGAEHLFGFTAAEIVGRNIDIIVPMELREETARRRVLLMQGAIVQGLETVRLNKDGRRIDVSQCVSPIRDASGVIFAVSNIMRDITTRKRAQRELQHQKKLLDAVIENLPVSVAVKDAKTMRFMKFNRIAEEMSLLEVNQYLGKTAHDLFPKEQADDYVKTDLQALRSRQMVDIPEQKLTNKAGETRIRHTRKVPIYNDDGEPWMLVGIGEDITDRKKTEDELERQKKLLEMIIEHLPVGVVVKDPVTMRYLMRNSMSPATIYSLSLERQGATTFISDNVTAQLGWLPADFIGEPLFWAAHIHPDDRAHAVEAFSHMADGGKYHCEYRFRHRDGRWRWIRDEGRTVCDENGVVYEAIGSRTDITGEHMEAEIRLRRALLQRDTLVREIHHRIKNNIQGVIGLLRRKIKSHSVRAPEIEEAILQLQTIAMVYDLEGKGANTPLSLTAMLDSICILAENFAGESVARTYQSKLRQPLHIVVEEGVAVAVALNELIFNALKHQTADANKKLVRIASFLGLILALQLFCATACHE